MSKTRLHYRRKGDTAMTHFQLHGPSHTDHTPVSDVFLDEYMPAANGEYVKVYLYLLRCLKSDIQELSISLIADKFDHTESDVQRALKYWEKMHLLKLEYDESEALTGICLTQENAEAAASRKSPSFKASAPAGGELPAPSAGTAPFSREETRQLLFICEQYLGKTLSSTEVSRILYFHDTLGFSADLIEYLVEYCVSKGHKSLRYIESTALGWHKSGCTTVVQAKQQTSTYSKAYFSILKAFGISGRNPVEGEIAYMNKWLKDWNFSQELIAEACSRTMTAIHQPSFEYADSILSRWKTRGVTRLSDLDALDEQHQAARKQTEGSAAPKTAQSSRFHNFRERSYNFQELEKQLINH